MFWILALDRRKVVAFDTQESPDCPATLFILLLLSIQCVVCIKLDVQLEFAVLDEATHGRVCMIRDTGTGLRSWYDMAFGITVVARVLVLPVG